MSDVEALFGFMLHHFIQFTLADVSLCLGLCFVAWVTLNCPMIFPGLSIVRDISPQATAVRSSVHTCERCTSIYRFTHFGVVNLPRNANGRLHVVALRA